MRASLSRKYLWVAAGLLLAVTPRPAAAGQQDHQYSSSDIQAGLKLYTAECSLCHGPNGDLMSGIDLRRGSSGARSPTRTSRRVITTGVPAAGMPRFKLQPAEVDAADRVHPRRLRRQRHGREGRRSHARPDAVCGQGRLRDVPSRQRHRPARRRRT